MDGFTDVFCPTSFWNNKLSLLPPMPPPASHLSHVFMLWKKWCNMGEKKQGIWFTRYAYGHNIWQTQGIWPSCSLGCAGKLDAAFTVSVSFFSQHVDLVSIIRTHLPFLNKSPLPVLSLLISSETPCSLHWFSVSWWASNSQNGLALEIPLTSPTHHTNKKRQQKRRAF